VSEATTEPPRRRRGRPSSGAREAVLAATLELIREEGLAQLRTRDVAERAGVSEASVFYHFKDKVGLLQEALLTGLEPLRALDPEVAAGHADRPLADTLLEVATALEAFFDHAMPVLSAVQSDSALRPAFAERLTKGDHGPHRGVGLLAGYLTGMAERGLLSPGVDVEAAGALLTGTCFQRSWLRYLAGPRRRESLPGLRRTVHEVARLLSPSDTED
jgi:AcrR family transcriptional regulator